jgi:hypothetical protein
MPQARAIFSGRRRRAYGVGWCGDTPLLLLYKQIPTPSYVTERPILCKKFRLVYENEKVFGLLIRTKRK